MDDHASRTGVHRIPAATPEAPKADGSGEFDRWLAGKLRAWGGRVVGWLALLGTGAAGGVAATRDTGEHDAPRDQTREQASGPEPEAPAIDSAKSPKSETEIEAVTVAACELAATEHRRCQTDARLAIDTFGAMAESCGATVLPRPGEPPAMIRTRKESTP